MYFAGKFHNQNMWGRGVWVLGLASACSRGCELA